jgi:phage shock protein A
MNDSIIDKVRIAVLSRLNALLDTVVNTPEAYEQRIRDLKAALGDLRAARDESVGATTGLDRSITAKQTKFALTQGDIDLLLGDDDPSNDEAALKLQLKLGTLQSDIEQLQEQKSLSETTTAELADAVSKLEAKHDEMASGLRQLTLTAAATSAKNRAADAAEKAIDATADAGNIDSIRAHIESENDTANARFDRVIGGMKEEASPEAQVALARAQQALEQRRREIADAATQ